MEYLAEYPSPFTRDSSRPQLKASAPKSTLVLDGSVRRTRANANMPRTAIEKPHSPAVRWRSSKRVRTKLSGSTTSVATMGANRWSKPRN